MTANEKTKEKKSLSEEKDSTNRDFPLFYTSTVAYTIMATIGIVASLYWHGTFWDILTPDLGTTKLIKLVAASILASGILLIASYFFEDWFDSFREVKNSVKKLLGQASIPMIIYLALISAVGEELLFRAALLPYTGLLFSSLLFGLMHINPESGGLGAWSVWAFLAGMLLGWLFEATGSLWPPIFAHFMVNAVALTRLQIEMRKAQRNAQSK